MSILRHFACSVCFSFYCCHRHTNSLLSPTPNIQSHLACRPRQRMSFKNIMRPYAHGLHRFCFQLDMAMLISPLVLVVMQYLSPAYPYNRNATPMGPPINLIQNNILVHQPAQPSWMAFWGRWGETEKARQRAGG